MPSDTMETKIPITFAVTVYNEELRIRPVLEQACRWADEILVLDKSSTDNTGEICEEYGDRVKRVLIPYSPKGHDDMVSSVGYASNDWIFCSTASELPTYKLIKAVKTALMRTQGSLDLIYVPRKIYSFGIHSSQSPWSVSYYPFLLNRKKAIISNTIHENVRPRQQANTVKIPFKDDCCVYHLTHPTAKQYLSDMMQYFEAEVEACTDYATKIKQCSKFVREAQMKMLVSSDESFGLYCAWMIYWLGTALYLWEKRRGVNVSDIYSKLRHDLLEQEWSIDISGRHELKDGKYFRSPILWDKNRTIKTENDLLLTLKNQKLSDEIKVLYIVGAHRFQEKELIEAIFPAVEQIYLFEPLPELSEDLIALGKSDTRIRAYPYAISDFNGPALLHVASNDGASSSLLPLTRHKELFPEVKQAGTVTVQCRTLESIIQEYKLRPPDMLFLDVQGAEYTILSSLSTALTSKIKLIYSEASTEMLYAGAKLLDDLKHILKSNYFFVGFAPLHSKYPMHGNAMFVNRNQIEKIAEPGFTDFDAFAEEPASFVARFINRVLKMINRDGSWRG